MEKPLYKHFASLIGTNENLENRGFSPIHEGLIERLCDSYMPGGSGFDTGTKFNFDDSTSDKLVFNTSYHHMDENGSYDGWTDHEIVVSPSLQFDFDLEISGDDRDDIKEIIHQEFSIALAESLDDAPIRELLK